MQKQLSRPLRLMRAGRTFFVRAYMHIIQENLTIFYPGVAVFKVDFMGPHRFDFRTDKGDPDLESLIYVEVVAGFAVCDYYFII